MGQVIAMRKSPVQQIPLCPCGSGLPARRRYEFRVYEWRTRCAQCDPIVYHPVVRDTASLEGDDAQREARARRRIEDLRLAREVGCSVEDLA